MIIANNEAKELELVATVTRADGSIEELGTIAYWNKNPLKLLWWKIKQFFKGL
jgi:hypothetical protein